MKGRAIKDKDYIAMSNYHFKVKRLGLEVIKKEKKKK